MYSGNNGGKSHQQVLGEMVWICHCLTWFDNVKILTIPNVIVLTFCTRKHVRVAHIYDLVMLDKYMYLREKSLKP